MQQRLWAIINNQYLPGTQYNIWVLVRFYKYTDIKHYKQQDDPAAEPATKKCIVPEINFSKMAEK